MGLGPIVAMGLISNYMVTGLVLPLYFAYGGLLMVIVMSMLASAYAITKIVEASVNGSQISSFYHLYRGGSTLGDYLGLWELGNVLIF